MAYLTLTPASLDDAHICCAFSDKKCQASYQAKKQWLKQEYQHGYRFRRLDERAKVFIEYGPAETAWQPIQADGYLALGCFWVSGKYKGHGHGKQLLADAIEAAKQQNKQGLVAVVGKKKYHFMSDIKWLKGQGFNVADEAPNGFVLLYYPLNDAAEIPQFRESVHTANVSTEGCVVYYSHRCPYAEYHVLNSLQQSCAQRGIPLEVHHLEILSQAQACPSPATIFSLYYQGEFITTDISACMESRFDKFIPPHP